MIREKIKVGFIGTGGIARSHAYAINSLPFYYNNAPEVSLEMACSETEKSRTSFVSRYGFSKPANFEEFINNKEINSVFILGPNKVHVSHLRKVLGMNNVKRIYIEKPVCACKEEEIEVAKIIESCRDIRIQVGFQYLFMSPVRNALRFWKSGKLGKPIHFESRYYHGDYLKKEYRGKRGTRLTPAPEGGAMADLGSHAISLAIAFFGENLQITGSLQAGSFEDVDPASDLFSSILLFDPQTKAAGTLSASRVSSGTGDMLTMDIYAEKGALRFSSHTPDYFEYHLEETGTWTRVPTGSNYDPCTSFPSGHVPPGWLRPMVHAHYVFLTDGNEEAVMPDLEHGLAVQRLVRGCAKKLAGFRLASGNF